MNPFRPVILLTFIALLCGCAELSLISFGKGKLFEASARNPVIEVMALWEPAEGNGVEGLPSRGFAGQVLFFTPGHPQSVKVDGDICIYVFDDFGNEQERAKPIHQFTFDAGSWNTFVRESDLGASYQLFVPYTRPGQWQASCSVRVRYTPRDGGNPVYSKMATVALPGRPRKATQQKSQPEGNSVSSPVGAPAQTESASVLSLPAAVSGGLQSKLADLQAAAASTASQLNPPAMLTLEAAAQPLSGEPAGPTERRSYRLSR